MRTLLRCLPVALLAALAAIQFVSPADPSDVAVPNARVRGERLYDLYCADCHGSDARGSGPEAADLRRPPADLTRLSQAAGGRFPETEVRTSIDGRFVPHQDRNREMPIWGFAFQDQGSDANQEQSVQVRIDDLLRYLKSIQRVDRP